MTTRAGMLRLARAVPRRGFASTAARRENYAFIGLGQMGFQMAKNLQAKLAPSDRISLFDVNAAAASSLEKEMDAGGAAVEIARSAQDASRDADTVITVLPEPQHVRAVYDSILAGGLPPRDRLYIDCSTIDPSTSRGVAASVAAAATTTTTTTSDQGVEGVEGVEGIKDGSRGSTFVDAPMSGGVVGAAAATLTFMLGAPAGAVRRAEPTLLRMGGRVLHCGPQGAGLAAKLANNYLLAVSNIATAEAMNLGVRWGLDPATLAGVLNASTGRCWPSEVNNPVPGVVGGAPAGRDYRGGFGIGLMRKDLRLAMVAAREAGARMELAGRAWEVYDGAAGREDCRDRDFSVVYRYLGREEDS